MHVHAAARAVAERFRHEGADQIHVARDFASRHAEQHKAISGGQCVCVGVVNLKLAVGILVINLVDIEIDRLQRCDEPLEKITFPGEALVVIAWLLEHIRFISRTDAAVGAPLEHHELRFDTDIDGPAFGLRFRYHLFQHETRIERIRLTLDGAVAHDTRIARLPGQQRQRA